MAVQDKAYKLYITVLLITLFVDLLILLTSLFVF